MPSVKRKLLDAGLDSVVCELAMVLDCTQSNNTSLQPCRALIQCIHDQLERKNEGSLFSGTLWKRRVRS